MEALPIGAYDAVVRAWVWTLTHKQQSALFSGLRGPDTQFCSEIKKLSKFIRQATQYNADPSTGYMEENWHDINLKRLEQQIEFCTIHYVAHLLESLALVESYCDDIINKNIATHILEWFEQTFHMAPRRFKNDGHKPRT